MFIKSNCQKKTHKKDNLRKLQAMINVKNQQFISNPPTIYRKKV